MLKNKVRALGMFAFVLAVSQGISLAYANHVNVIDIVTRKHDVVEYHKGERWGDLKQRMEALFKREGRVVFAGNFMHDEHIIDFDLSNESTLHFAKKAPSVQ